MSMDCKTCTRCQQLLPLGMFNIRRERRTLQYHSYCRPCMRARHRVRYEMGSSKQSLRIWPAVHRAENNAFNLCHGPVSREQPLRWQA